ncbi:efflux transporter outer membrane subunit [Paucibacter sp. O1-1]|nr:efflux transporter outer membrane subunit [Paucibacter sp. O1-1]MDA3826132.1 efflux transporter outer membrane subunit [Paucibacter sp. O1-1]
MRAHLSLMAAALLLAGCANLAPEPQRPVPPLPDWPSLGAGESAAIDWREFITEPRLLKTIDQSLANNRDLRIAVLNIERARALYRIERADRLPTVNATVANTRQGEPASGQYTVRLGLSSYELDFFGRVRNLSEAALQSFFAVEENRRSSQISLVAEVASAWLNLAADAERLKVARETLQSQQASLSLTERALALGAVSELGLAQARATVETARVDVARYTSQLAQDRNALELLVGGPLAAELLPAEGSLQGPTSVLLTLPAGLPSEVLQRRPDVRAAEYRLRAAEADIGAARAAFFPSISLTASAGTQSASLGGLFSGGSGVWSFVPQINLPLFDAGRRRAALQLSEADRELAVAGYEKTVQTAFREVADALAERGGLAEQLDAQQALTAANERRFALSNTLYQRGASSYLEVLDSQRSLYAARQGLVSVRLNEQLNRIALYRALGGG